MGGIEDASIVLLPDPPGNEQCKRSEAVAQAGGDAGGRRSKPVGEGGVLRRDGHREPTPSKDVMPYLPSEQASREEMGHGFRRLVTQGARRAVRKAMSSEALRGPAPISER